MSETDLLARVEDGVAVLTMNRPDALNALTRPMMKGMWDALERYGADPEVGCIVLTGAGRGFCAGGDVKAMASGEKNLGTFEAKAADLRSRMDIVRLLHAGPKPTIAMVNGVAAGAGLGLALACDMRVAGASARMTTAFAKVGLSGDFGGTWFLNRLVGPAARGSSTSPRRSWTPTASPPSASPTGSSRMRRWRPRRWRWRSASPPGRASR